MSRTTSLKQSLTIARQEFLLRDQGTFLGFFWTLLNPVLLFVSLYGVFAASNGNHVLNSGQTYAPYLFCGLIFWNYFSNLTTSLGILFPVRTQYFLLTDISVTTMVIATTIVQFWIALLETIIGTILIRCFFHASLTTAVGTILGLIVATPFTVLIGVALIWIQAFFNDMMRLWSLSLRIGFFLTPIFYSATIVTSALTYVMQFNPLLPFLTIIRSPLNIISVPNCAALVGVTGLFLIAALYITEKNRGALTELC